jgi:hypothetical protein
LACWQRLLSGCERSKKAATADGGVRPCHMIQLDVLGSPHRASVVAQIQGDPKQSATWRATAEDHIQGLKGKSIATHSMIKRSRSCDEEAARSAGTLPQLMCCRRAGCLDTPLARGCPETQTTAPAGSRGRVDDMPTVRLNLPSHTKTCDTGSLLRPGRPQHYNDRNQASVHPASGRTR